MGPRNDFSTGMDTSSLTLVKGGRAGNYKLREFHIHSPSEHKINGR